MYASPIIYPITMMPENIRQIMLLNPFAFIVHFAKQGLISNTFTSFGHFILLFSGVTIAVVLAFLSFRKYEKRVAEFI
jgi:lipopolysaccharide transport system permease protein